MYSAYTIIFNEFGLKFRAVEADSGSIGGAISHEFHVLADSGEDAIAFSTGSQYAANVENAKALLPEQTLAAGTESLQKVATPTQKTISEVSEFLGVSASQVLKTLAVMRKVVDEKGNETEQFFNLFLRGDYELNEIKTKKLIGDFRLATEAEIESNHACSAGFLGVRLNADNSNALFDNSVKYLTDFVCGANEVGFHLRGCNWLDNDAFATIYNSALANNQFQDIRNVIEGDLSPDGLGTLTLARGIEVGHIFQLGTKYSGSMKAGIINEGGKHQIMIMGCYGIGISRVVAAAIEQNHDERGIIWSKNLAPFQVALLPMNLHKSERLIAATEKLYQELTAAGIEVLLDDRKVRAGFMFSDMELIGIPHCLIISDKGLEAGFVEYKARTASENQDIALSDILSFLKGVI
jgi:prolyl-tRNA synthetase